jgi:hypothetical protein
MKRFVTLVLLGLLFVSPGDLIARITHRDADSPQPQAGSQAVQTPKQDAASTAGDKQPEDRAKADAPDPVAVPQEHPNDSSAPVPNAPNPQAPAPAKPVGTAAAPYETTTGITAARPAGAVIAPGRQRRSRFFVIRIALIAGAVVAVGTVVALSQGSSSKP